MTKQKVIIIDDEDAIRFGIKNYLIKVGFDVCEADSCNKARELFYSFQPDIAIIDYMLPDGNALDLLQSFKESDPDVPLLILTAHGTIDLAVEAIKKGAEQFLTKPIELSALLVLLQRLLENRRDRKKRIIEDSRRADKSLDPFIGTSAEIRELEKQTKRLTLVDSPVLLQGETGTGKSILARWIHNNSPRSSENLVELNCASLSHELLETELFGYQKGAFTGAISNKSGLLEVANNGTVFLDEIGDMDLQIQPKLLKVLEEKQFRRVGDLRDRSVDIRLIAATNQELTLLVQEKKFRSDLLFRINTFPINIPPLRDRNEDIPLLAAYLLKTITLDMKAGEMEILPEAEDILRNYHWPGNIRELRNVLERAVLLSDAASIGRKQLRFDPLPGTETNPRLPILNLEDAERQHIENVLKRENWNVDRAAVLLGVPRSSLYHKIKRHRISLSKV